MSDDPIYVFLVAWNRSHYLWACLDSLYRQTRYPCKFVIADNGSTDPQVREVIRGFERRGMFESIHLYDENRQGRYAAMLAAYRDKLGEYFVWADTDIVVTGDRCWLSDFHDLMQRHPNHVLMGSLIDTSDFIDLEMARRLMPEASDSVLRKLAKMDTGERRLKAVYDEEIIDPFNPPGRLLMCRTDPMAGLSGTDLHLYQTVKSLGREAGIATRVRHRHLSLLHPFDYPEFDVAARDRYYTHG